MLFSLRKTLLVAIVFAMLALLTLSACGGDDDDDSGVDGGNGPTATEDAGDGGDDDGDDDGEDPTDDAGGDNDGDDSDEEPTDDLGFDEEPSELAELACTLLTPEEIADETGFTVGDGEPSSIEGFADCLWDNEENFDTVSISLIAEGGEALYDFNNEEAEEIDGIGDRAQFLSGVLPLLEVMEDGLYMSVTVNAFDLEEEDEREAIIDLAEIAVDRLP